jgi:hypothetical protein
MMKPGWIVPVVLVAMSLLFFHIVIAQLTGDVLRYLGTSQEISILLSSAIYDNSLLALVAFCGGIVFLAATRHDNPSWYLGVPLILGFAFIAFSPAFFTVFPLRDPSPLFYDPLYVMALASGYGSFFLPPCAALFFWSQMQPGRWRTLLVAIALIISLNALAFLLVFFNNYLVASGLLPAPQPEYVDGHTVKGDGVGLLFLFIHLMIGMPVLGTCFVALAALTWHTGRQAAAFPIPSPEALP